MRRLVLLALLLWAGPVCGQGHLEPERSVFAEPVFNRLPPAPGDVVSVFHAAYDSDVSARLIVEPYFIAPQFAVGLKEHSGNYKIFSLHLKKPIADYLDVPTRKLKDGSVEMQWPGTLKEPVPVKECRADIDIGLAKRILSIWEKMLRDVRFPKRDTAGQDGETFHFSMFVSSQFLAGRVWSPPVDSKADLLVRVGLAMGDYCGKESRPALAKLDQDVSRLERAFQPIKAHTNLEPAATGPIQKIRNWFSSLR